MTRESVSDVVGERVAKLRRERGWSSYRRFAMECEQVGYAALTPAALANIETGRRDPETGRRRRDVSVDELLALAVALGVPPVALLVDPVKPSMQVTPTRIVPIYKGLLWLPGRAPLDEAVTGAWSDADRPFYLVAQLRLALERAEVIRADALNSPVPSEVDYQGLETDWLRRALEHLETLHRIGVQVELSPAATGRARELGLLDGSEG